MHTNTLFYPFCLVICFMMFSVLTVVDVTAQDHNDDHGHHINEHHDRPNEVGAAIGPVFDISENLVAFGLHLHYTRMLKGNPEKFGIGGGLETVFSASNHYNVSVMFVYRPIHPLWFSAGPGLTYYVESDEAKFSVHLETGYEFDINIIHIGPMIEYAFAGSEHHIMLGLHIGYPF